MYKDKSSDQYVLVGVYNSMYIYVPPYKDMLKETHIFGAISLHRKWIETKILNSKFCAPGVDVGNKVEARRCPFQLFITMCQKLEELRANTILIISDSFSIPVPLLTAGYVLLSLISVSFMYNDVKTTLEKFKTD